jgi:hypothetical protein
VATVDWRIKGQYLKNCNCIATCPCDTVGVPYPGRGCEGLSGVQIVEGHFGEVRLDGLTWAVIYHWPGPVHEGNGTAQFFIDERARPEQREALLQILNGRAGGPWFEILASVRSTLLEPQFVPITFEFDKPGRRGRLVVPGFGEAVCAPLTIPATGKEQRVIVQMPGGMEYKEMEVAQTVVLKGTGPIQFDHTHTHASLAEIEQTQAGLKG